MTSKNKKIENLQVFIKWVVLILLAMVLVAYIFRQLSWT